MQVSIIFQLPVAIVVVKLIAGKVTIIVMMETIIKNVNGMVEIAVVIMSTPTTALSVNA